MRHHLLLQQTNIRKQADAQSTLSMVDPLRVRAVNLGIIHLDSGRFQVEIRHSIQLSRHDMPLSPNTASILSLGTLCETPTVSGPEVGSNGCTCFRHPDRGELCADLDVSVYEPDVSL